MNRTSIIALLIFGAILGYFLSFGPDTTQKFQAGAYQLISPFLTRGSGLNKEITSVRGKLKSLEELEKDNGSLRVENRVPGGDVNPYLAIAGMVAGALYGIENALELEDPVTGNAYGDRSAPHVPATLRDAMNLWDSGGVAREAFGDEVVEHYANNALVELRAFEAAVTDWELYRGFERL